MKTAKPPLALEPEDLSVRVRRGDATTEERRAFEQALQASALLNAAHRVGRDFDDAGRVQAGDDALIARAAAGALSRPVPRKRTRPALLLGLAATLAIATSAAAGYWFSGAGSAPKSSPPSNDPSGLGGPTGRVAPPHLPPEQAAAESRPNAPLDAIAKTPSEPATPTHALATVHAAPKTAADLFREANAARRTQNFELARTLYTELQAKHPGTDEASVSRVSLGKLLLGSGQAREADRQFKAYLATGRKNLEEEALVGRADALGRLGESGEERRVWEDLLGRHPSSVYAARARQRLGELGGTDPSARP
jgi:tetratricopeptide (TPR) repeat protein